MPPRLGAQLQGEGAQPGVRERGLGGQPPNQGVALGLVAAMVEHPHRLGQGVEDPVAVARPGRTGRTQSSGVKELVALACQPTSIEASP